MDDARTRGSEAMPSKVLAFRSFQMDQPMRKKKVSKPFLNGFGSNFLLVSHQ
jgi:hypothetical protein